MKMSAGSHTRQSRKALNYDESMTATPRRCRLAAGLLLVLVALTACAQPGGGPAEPATSSTTISQAPSPTRPDAVPSSPSDDEDEDVYISALTAELFYEV